MTYAVSTALQSAIYARLQTDSALSALVGDAVYDMLPQGPLPSLYVVLGAETTTDASDMTGRGSVHLVTISVITAAPGFASAKTVAGTICDALVDADLTLSRGRLVSLFFDRAQALRITRGTGRRIDLRFRARLEDF